LGLGLWLALAGHSFGSPWVVAALAVGAAIAEKQRVWVVRQSEGSISLLPVLFAAVLFGPLAAMIVAAASMMGNFGAPYAKWFVYTCSRSISGAATGVVAMASLEMTSNRLVAIAIATVLGALVAEACDVAFAAMTVVLRGTAQALPLVRSVLPVLLMAIPLYAPIVALLAIAYKEVSPLTLPLFFAPTLAAQRLYGMYQEQRLLADDLASVNKRLERANLSFATALVATLDARDQYTAGHSAAVAIYAQDIAGRLCLSEREQELAHLCGLVHDIGKIGLPPGLLEKPGALTLEERRQMQEHSAIGERILAKVQDYAEIARIVRHHHERVDGEGYPDRLTGTEIPLLSKIIAVADAYNAMTSDRPYRDAMPSRVARMRLAQGVEGQFDTTVVAAFEAILAGATETYRLGSRSDFTLECQDLYSPPLADREVA
jgi:putative nucleotidyltransferase with HDIG domain